MARARLSSPADTLEEEPLNGSAIMCSRLFLKISFKYNPYRNETTTDAAPQFAGFVTAGSNKVITVTEASLQAAKRRLGPILDADPQVLVSVPS